MQVSGIDERHLVREGSGANYLVFIYEGGGLETPASEGVETSWSVDSYLLTDADLPHVLEWLKLNLPIDSCWSLGVVLDPEHPTADSSVHATWIVGDDVLNSEPRNRSPAEQRLADEMLARRHRVDLP